VADKKLTNNNVKCEQFKEILQKYDTKIFNLLLSLTGSTEEAKDLTQETFIKTFKKFRLFQKKSHPYTWLYRIAINSWKNKIRYDKRRGIPWQESIDTPQLSSEQPLISQFKDTATSYPEQIAQSEETRNYIRKFILSLSPKYRIPVTLYIKGFSYEEIAHIIKRRLGTVKSLIFRAKTMLKDKIIEYLK